MPKLNIAEELDIALREAARVADSRSTSLEIAAGFYESERRLIEPFIADWVIQRLAVLIGKHRAHARRENPPQLLLFEHSLGFQRLPKTIRLEGKSVPREKATIQVFRTLATQLRKQENPALQEAQNAIALMSKYTKTNQVITWGEVVKREAEKKRGERGHGARK